MKMFILEYIFGIRFIEGTNNFKSIHLFGQALCDMCAKNNEFRKLSHNLYTYKND